MLVAGVICIIIGILVTIVALQQPHSDEVELTVILCAFALGILLISLYVKKRRNAKQQLLERQLAEEAAVRLRDEQMRSWTVDLDYIKVLGTRSAVNTVRMGETRTDINSTLYSLLFIYKDGSQMTQEVMQNDMHYYSQYIRT